MENTLAEALSQYSESSESLRSKVADAFYKDSRITRIAAHYANRMGLAEIDEIKQEAVIIFTNNWLDRLDDPANVYYLLGDIIKRVCLGLKRNLLSHNEGRYTSLDRVSTSGQTGSDRDEHYEKVFRRDDESLANADADCIDRVENAMMKAALIREVRNRLGRDSRLAHLENQAIHLEQKLGLAPFAQKVSREDMLADVQKPKNNRAIASANDIKRLGEIRTELGMTIQDYAKILNTSKGALTSYLYGRAAPPKDIICLAENILKERGSLVAAASEAFAGRSMREICLDWAKQLGATEETAIAVLSATFQTAPVTIKRWLNEKTRPDIHALQNYDKKIREVVAAQKTTG